MASTPPPQNQVQRAKQKLHQMLHDPENPLAGIFDTVEQKAKIKREYLFIGVCVLMFLYLIVGHGTGLLVNLIGFLYPAYKSCKAIDSEEKDDDTQWLTYWVVYAAFGLIEYFTDILLSWIPFYFLGKCAFLIWCMMPSKNNGAAIIYQNIIRPFVKKHEKTFEKTIEFSKGIAKDMGKEALSAAKEAASNISVGDIQRLQDTISDLHDQVEEGSKKDD